MQKNKKRTHPGEQYIRYLISYMTILLIPLVILTIFYSSRFMKRFYEEIYETVDLELVQINAQLENELESMENIVGQLALTGTIRQITDARSPLELNPVITYLSGFSCANSFIEDIIVIPASHDYLVTTSTTCKKDYFFDRIFHIVDIDSETFLEQVIRPDSFVSAYQTLSASDNSQDNEELIFFSYPVYTDYQKYEGSVLFYTKKNSLQTLISQKLQSYHAQIYILNREKQLITSFGPEERSLDSLRSDQDNYIARSNQSSRTGWTCTAFLPDTQKTFSQVTDIMREFLIAIVLILLLASVTIFFLQKVNYAPVRRLRDKARQISPGGSSPEESKDELAFISHALDYLSIQNSTLSSQLASSLTAVKNERICRLLNGNYISAEDFNLDCSELDLYLPDSCFCVCILMLHTPVEDLDTLALEIKKQFADTCVHYYLHNFHPNQIVLLINLSEKAGLPVRQLSQIQHYLAKKHQLMTTIGISSKVNSTERIAQCYIEAVSALDYRFVKGNGTLIEFSEALGPQHTNVFYPHQEFETLRNALLARNDAQIRNAIQSIIQFMKQGQLPLYLARSICFDLIHLVNEHCLGQKNAASNSPIELSGVETAQEIIQMLQTWSGQLHDLTTSVEKASLDEILSFLAENCFRCDFSAYEAAEQFHMTLPAFSKYFKDLTGQNVMDYTIYLRIEKAKSLLKNTSLPLKEISEQVGYYNMSSFTRRFKLNQGITPSEYRKVSQKDKK